MGTFHQFSTRFIFLQAAQRLGIVPTFAFNIKLISPD